MFYQAEEDIMNLSNDEVDYQMFRVRASKLKETLRARA